MTEDSKPALPTLAQAVARGASGFGIVSLLVFATVAFAERWMYQRLTVMGAYAVWTALFILLGGAVLGSLVVGRWRLPRFYLLYGFAFFVYAAGWVCTYFGWGGALGEWLGSLVGSLLMAMVFVMGFGAFDSIIKLTFLLFVANSAGYFLGSALNNPVNGPGGMMLWGVVYGLCQGAGIGALLQMVQQETVTER